MPKPKIKAYLDTTIPSFYHDTRRKSQGWRAITREWFDSCGDAWEFWSSEITLAELSDGEYPEKTDTLSFMRNIRILDEAPDIREIAQYYIDAMLMPKNPPDDAYHLAYTSFHKMEYLVSWNYDHLVNTNKKTHINIANTRLGLRSPEIVSPMDLMRKDNQ